MIQLASLRQAGSDLQERVEIDGKRPVDRRRRNDDDEVKSRSGKNIGRRQERYSVDMLERS